ncbi:MAG: ATP-binding cassette domain-containing protein [Solirubrobacteraceae bacterium]
MHTHLWGVSSAKATRRIDELVDTLGLAELIERPVSSYSGGERRRLEIARALSSQPQVLFLDEPTVGLDPRIRRELLEVIASLRAREELTILLTTHYLDEAQRLCDRVAIIHEGSLVALDSPPALLAGLGREILEFRVDGSPERALASLRARRIAGDDAFAIGARITVPLHDRGAAAAITAIESEHLRASEITTRAPNLDDVYLQLTGGSLSEAA